MRNHARPNSCEFPVETCRTTSSHAAKRSAWNDKLILALAIVGFSCTCLLFDLLNNRCTQGVLYFAVWSGDVALQSACNLRVQFSEFGIKTFGHHILTSALGSPSAALISISAVRFVASISVSVGTGMCSLLIFLLYY